MTPLPIAVNSAGCPDWSSAMLRCVRTGAYDSVAFLDTDSAWTAGMSRTTSRPIYCVFMICKNSLKDGQQINPTLLLKTNDGSLAVCNRRSERAALLLVEQHTAH